MTTYAKEAKRKALQMLIDDEHVRRLDNTVCSEGDIFNHNHYTVPKDIQCSTDFSISDENRDSDDNLSDLDALEGKAVLSDYSDDSNNWEPSRKSEGPETVLNDSDTDEDYNSDNWEPLKKSVGPKTVLNNSDTDEDCSVPDGSVPGPPCQDDPDEADCQFEAHHGESHSNNDDRSVMLDDFVPGPPPQDDPDEADCPFEAYHGELPYGRKCIFVR